VAKNVILIVTIENVSLHLQKCAKNVTFLVNSCSTVLWTVLHLDVFRQKKLQFCLQSVTIPPIFVFFVHTVTFCNGPPDGTNFFYPKLRFFKAF